MLTSKCKIVWDIYCLKYAMSLHLIMSFDGLHIYYYVELKELFGFLLVSTI